MFAQDYGNNAEALKLCSALQTNQFGTDVEAENALDKILNAIGASKRFVLQPCGNINNAVATSYKGIRYILYDRDFMNSVNNGNNWGNLFVLAHEVGHHINGHSLDLVLYAADAVGQQTLAQSRQDELEADEFAGFILAKLGGPLSAANKVISSFSSNRDDTYSTHPSTTKRLAAAKRGYTKFSGIKEKNTIYNENSFDVIYYSNGRWEGPVKTNKEDVASNGYVVTQISRRPYGKGAFIFSDGEIYEGYFKDDLLNKKRDLAEDYYYEAKKELDENNIEEAERLFNLSYYSTKNKYLKFHCKYELGSINFFNELAKTHKSDEADYDASIRHFTDALSLNTDLNNTHSGVYYLLTNSYFKKDGNRLGDNLAKIVDYGEKWIEISSNNPNNDLPFSDLILMGYVTDGLVRSKNYNQAIKYQTLVINEGLNNNILEEQFKFSDNKTSVYRYQFFKFLKDRAVTRYLNNDFDGAREDFDLIDKSYNIPFLKEDSKIENNYIQFYRGQFFMNHHKYVSDFDRSINSWKYLIANTTINRDSNFGNYHFFIAYNLKNKLKYVDEGLKSDHERLMCKYTLEGKKINNQNNISIESWTNFINSITFLCN